MNKRQRIPGQLKKDHPQKLASQGTQNVKSLGGDRGKKHLRKK